MPNLEKCQLITNEEYCMLNNPKFVGQTKINNNGVYYMVWEIDGKYYKTKNIL